MITGLYSLDSARTSLAEVGSILFRSPYSFILQSQGPSTPYASLVQAIQLGLYCFHSVRDFVTW